MASKKLKHPVPVTWYLQITSEYNIIFTANKKYNPNEAVKILHAQSQAHEKHKSQNPKSRQKPSALDFRFISGAEITFAFGNTMSGWTFWKNDEPQFCSGKNQAISISHDNLAGKGWFLEKDISTSAKKLTFMYTGEDGTVKKPLKCKYNLCIKNTLKNKTTKFETKIIIDPIGKDDGKWP